MAHPLRPPCESRDIAGHDETECKTSQRPFILAAAVLGSSMVFIDGSALSVAIPALRETLSAGPSELNWIFNAYTLALAALILIGGAASDRWGAARVFILGAAGFSAASIACGLSNGSETLIAARALQGVFGAALTPAALALIAAAYPKKERSAAIGVWAGSSALATAGGPVLGGWLVESFGWESIFFINAPIGMLAILTAFWGARGLKVQTEDKPFDLIGAALIALTLGFLAYGLVGLGEGMAELTLAITSLVLSVMLGMAFIWRQKTAASPMVPLSIFASGRFTGVNLSTLFLYTALSLAFMALPIFASDIRGWSATEIGLAFLPFTLTVGFLSGRLGAITEAIDARWSMAGGSALAAMGFALFAVAVDGPAWLGVYLPMLIAGLGFALVIPPLTATALGSAPDRYSGLASGVNNAAARIASMIGVALAAAFLAAQVTQSVVFLVAALCAGLAVVTVLLSVKRRNET